ncbi:hypothetical protein RB597_003777 [Gaeumannomyces tritici]
MPEEGDTRERLKAALWFSIGKIVDEETMKRQRNATPQFIGALTDMVYTQIENVAKDLESFSNHAGRKSRSGHRKVKEVSISDLRIEVLRLRVS